MQLGISCGAFQVLEAKLRMTMLKKCRRCGVVLDLGEWMRQTAGFDVIPVCEFCGEPLWKGKRSFLLWTARRRNAEQGS